MPVILKAITPKRVYKFDENKLKSDVRRNMTTYLNDVKRQLQQYPPQRNHTYQRTERLKRGWQVLVTADGSEGYLINDVRYAVYAQGPRGGGRGIGARQTRLMHSLGWPSITDVARATRKNYVDLMNRAVKGQAV